MRLFFAIGLDDRVRAAVADSAAALQARLAASGAGRAVKWVERENLHVTLRFLGEVPETAAEALIRSCSRPLAAPPVAIEVGGAGCFPSAGAPRVIWAGITEGTEGARHAYDALEQRLNVMGFAPEPRAYTPHLTLGRVRDIDRARGRELRGWLAAVPRGLGRIDAGDLTLYRSHLSSAGPRYEIVARLPLDPHATGPADARGERS